MKKANQPGRPMKKIYFGGSFPAIDINNPEDSIKGDFRVQILGEVNRLLHLPENEDREILLSDQVSYVGPYYFYGKSIQAWQAVTVEKEMILKCTDTVFLLENTSIPGTITELVYAALLGKNVHIFYVSLETGTPETEINSEQWYPIAFARMMGKNIECVECNSREDAVERILSFVKTMN